MAAKKISAVTKRGSAKGGGEGLNFAALVLAIQRVHAESAATVNRVINTTVTLRNWIIGAYIVEYEMCGADRAKYGEKLLDRLAERLTANHVPSCERRRLYIYRQFFQTYPQIVESLSPLFPDASSIVLSATAQSGNRLKAGGAAIVRSVTAQLAMPAEKLLNSLSYTHFEQLLGLEDPLKRAFYEIECIRGNWSVRALKRQIATLYFERSGLSKDKEKLSRMVQQGVETAEPALAIRNPYIFEFLGLRARDAMAESDHPPVGLRLCTGKDQALVQYATASIDSRLFVSKYAVQLPAKAELEQFLHARHLEMLGKV